MVLDTAVVGLGEVSETHLTGIDENPRTRLAAVCDLDSVRARRAAREHGISQYTDVDELIASENLDWAHVCTPVQTHVDLAGTLVDAGIPVLIEKPVAETAADVEELAALSEERGVPVTPVQNHVFDPAVRELTRRIRSGDVGEVRGVDTIYVGQTLPDEVNRGSWVFDLPGGEFEEGLPHPIYLTLATGGWPRSDEAIDAITSLSREYDHGIEYDGAQVQYTTDEGALCSIKMFAGSMPQRQVYVHGSDNSYVADLVSQTVVPVESDYTASAISRARNNVDRSAALLRGTAENALSVAKRQFNDDWESKRDVNPHFYQFDREAAALENGTEMPIPLEQSRWTIRVMEAMRAAC